jgi:cell division protein FtsB
MGRVNETIHNVNTTLRTLLMLVLTGGAALVGYKGYEVYNEPQKQLADREAELEKTRGSLQQVSADLAARQQEISQLTEQVAEKDAQIERLEVSRKLLQVRRRLARLTVLDQRELPASDSAQPTAADAEDQSSTNLISRIEFVEVNDEGDPIGEAKQFDIIGDMVYVDYLRVTFDDKYIEESDLDRSTAIALFQRIFGEHQEAAEGFLLDTVGTRPTAYARGTEMSDFERKIWNDFWLIANDSQQAAELGIHAAHGSAVSMRVQPGKTYEIELRATGDMTIKPVEKAPANAEPGS